MNKSNRGFVLVVFVAVFMTLFTVVWLIHAKNLQHQQQAFEEQFQYQLHQTRVQLFWRAMQKPKTQSWLTWQISQDIQGWLEQLELNGLTAQVEINPVRLVIDLQSVTKAAELSSRMAHSTAHGTVLKLAVPDIQAHQERTPWLYREHLAMETNLSGGGHALLNVGQLSGDAMQLEVLQSSYLDSAAVRTETLATQHMNSQGDADINNVTAINLVSKQIQATQGDINQVTASSLVATNATSSNGTLQTATVQTQHALDLAATSVQVNQAVQLQGGAQQRLNEMYHQLASLEQSIYRCIEETLWCLAPAQPNATIQSCLNCQQEQQTPYFEAVVTINVGICIHGCGIRVSAPTGVVVACPERVVQERQQGSLQCYITSTLVDMNELAFDLQIEVYSGKNAAVYTQLSAPIRWQLTFSTCEPANHTVTVDNSAPTMNYTLFLPEHQGGELYFWNGTIYQECRASGRSTFMRCELFASCTTDGEWFSIDGRCSCHGW